MEEVAEGLGRGFLRLIKWIIIDAFIESFIYWYGYVTLNTFTLGKYPKPNQNNDDLCIVAGVISLAITIDFIMLFNYK
jgi:hypothetical protein